jgi:Mg-chelatase subunit ChlD
LENSQPELLFARSWDKFSKIRSVAIDTERDFITFGLVEQICAENGEKCLRLEELSVASMASAVCDDLPYGQGMMSMNKGGEKP